MRLARALVIVPYLVLATLPLGWLALTSFKSYEDTITAHAEVRARNGGGRRACRGIGQVHGDRRRLSQALAARGRNVPRASTTTSGTASSSGVLSTLAAVCSATLCAYGFSRFRIPGTKDWLFFVLSTRFLPPLAVVVPVLIMYRRFGLENTHLGLDPALHELQPVARGLADEGVHRRDPARVRRGGAGRRVLAPRRLPARHRAASGDRHGRDGGVLPDLVLERVRLRDDAEQLRGQDRAGLLRRSARKHRRRAVAADRGGDDDLRGADRAVHRAGAQAPARGVTFGTIKQ